MATKMRDNIICWCDWRCTTHIATTSPAVGCLHILKQSVFMHLVQCTVSVLEQSMYELYIHEPSSELVKIAQVSCGDFDICIYFETLFLVNMHCACLCAHVNMWSHVYFIMKITEKLELTDTLSLSLFPSLHILLRFFGTALSASFQLLCCCLGRHIMR